jgi:hypothetical protein
LDNLFAANTATRNALWIQGRNATQSLDDNVLR